MFYAASRPSIARQNSRGSILRREITSTPDGDIQAPQRSNLAILMDYLQREQRRAIDQVRADC